MIIGKEYHLDAAHFIPGHPKCGILHGHTYTITVEVSGPCNEQTNFMVIDLHNLNNLMKPILEFFDHKTINSCFSFTPTCENIASFIFDYLKNKLPINCSLESVKVQEGQGGYAICNTLKDGII